MIRGGPNIVDDSSLIFYMDFADVKSYVSGSPYCYDMINRFRSGSLLYGCGYDTGSKSMTFDGISGSIKLNNFVSLTNTHTVDLWFYPIPSSDSYGTLFTQDANIGIWYRGAAKKISFYVGTGDHSSNYTFTENNWYNICVVSNVGTSSFYINSSVDPNWFTGSTGYNANRMGDDPGSETFKGKIAAVRVYNRVLTSDEILQNYTMMRGRFNLR